MVPIQALWLPVLLSAIAVFLASSILHMVLRYHDSDYAALPDEEAVRQALRPLAISPGDYAIPRPADRSELKSADFQARARGGPVAFLTVLPNGELAMGRELAYWFVYALVVSVFAAYIAGRALGPGSSFPNVLRFAGATSFIGYSLALWQLTIWYHRRWTTSLKSTIDGLIYAVATGAIFAWFWPM